MNIEEIMKINETYNKRVKEENYTNDRNMDIYTISSAALRWYDLVGTESDRDTFGEFTRRFEYNIKELKALLGRT